MDRCTHSRSPLRYPVPTRTPGLPRDGARSHIPGLSAGDGAGRVALVGGFTSMIRRRVLMSALAALATAALLLAAVFTGTVGARPLAAATSGAGQPEVNRAIHSDTSPPLRDLVHYRQSSGVRRDAPLRLLPVPQGANIQPDPVVQASAPGPQVGATLGLNFAGIGDTSNTPANPCNCAPSDTNGTVGATQFLQWVNTAFAVYAKATSALKMGPTAVKTLWAA